MSLAITRLAGGGVITNYFCASACPHCLYRCSAGRTKDYIDPATLRLNYRRIRELGCSRVHLGGGEPFLRPEGLAEAVALAAEEEIDIEYVETSAVWYRDQEEARELLATLKVLGLSRLLVSVSPMLNAYVPLKKTLGVMEAAHAVGMGVLTWSQDFLPDVASFDPDTTHPLEEYLERFGERYLSDILDRTWIHFGGRAFEMFSPVLPRRPLEAVLSGAGGSCKKELADTSHFHLDLYGDYVPGLCAGLAIRREDLGRELPAERYPILSVLAEEGVAGLFAYAAGLEEFIPRPDGYLGKCELCQAIREHLVARGWFDSVELSPAEFYLTP